MAFKPRGMQRIARFGLQSGGSTRDGVTPAEERSSEADAFLHRAAQQRTGRADTGEKEPMTKGEERRMKLMRLRGTGAPVATSAMHGGVTARSEDQRVNQLLEQRRAQQKGRGTSAARIRKKGKEEDEDPDETGEQEAVSATGTERGTSAARVGPDAQLNLQPLPPGILHPGPPKKQEPPDMVI